LAARSPEHFSPPADISSVPSLDVSSLDLGRRHSS
jgi:hypothetical protein